MIKFEWTESFPSTRAGVATYSIGNANYSRVFATFNEASVQLAVLEEFYNQGVHDGVLKVSSLVLSTLNNLEKENECTVPVNINAI